MREIYRMGFTKRVILAWMFIFGIFHSPALGYEKTGYWEKEEKVGFLGVPSLVYSASGWVLNVYITQKGTRSQGLHGVLLHHENIIPGEPNEVRILPIGKVVYRGSLELKMRLWESSGWVMVEPAVEPRKKDAFYIPQGSFMNPEPLDHELDEFIKDDGS